MRHRLFLALILTASLQPLAAQTIQVNKDNKTIAITATDSAETEADTADITIGFTAYGTDEQKTYADATVTSNRIVAALTAAGIPSDHIRSTSQNLSRIETDDKLHFAQGIRFTFSQGWKVTTKASNASDVLHLAVTSGANNSGGIDWRIADDNALEAEAARKALEHAQHIAERMASGLHAKLGLLVYASNQAQQRDSEDRSNQPLPAAALAPPPRVSPKPLAIIPDKVSRSATVYAVFALE